PVLRTTQLGHMFSQSYGPYINLGEAERNEWPKHPDGNRNRATRVASLMQPFFSPGIMFNTIKS
ncbi:MAG TPA: hypothetical protein DCM40_02735, partial [Maribacter sp.]|nr:hypothetical protein [Maribacter sp.]